MAKGLWRRPSFRAIAVIPVALGIFLAFAVFGIQTLFFNTEINEDFDAPAPTSAEQGSRRTDSAATRLDLHLVQTLLSRLRHGPFAVGPTCPAL